MMILLIVIGSWLLVSVLVALFIGRAVRVADRQRALLVAQRSRPVSAPSRTLLHA